VNGDFGGGYLLCLIPDSVRNKINGIVCSMGFLRARSLYWTAFLQMLCIHKLIMVGASVQSRGSKSLLEAMPCMANTQLRKQM
jgi:hypothetical protein